MCVSCSKVYEFSQIETLVLALCSILCIGECPWGGGHCSFGHAHRAIAAALTTDAERDGGALAVAGPHARLPDVGALDEVFAVAQFHAVEALGVGQHRRRRLVR